MTWLIEYGPTILVGVVVTLIIGSIVWKMVQDKKNHVHTCAGCSGNCGGCSGHKT